VGEKKGEGKKGLCYRECVATERTCATFRRVNKIIVRVFRAAAAQLPAAHMIFISNLQADGHSVVVSISSQLL
jgi:hypothetical protein